MAERAGHVWSTAVGINISAEDALQDRGPLNDALLVGSFVDEDVGSDRITVSGTPTQARLLTGWRREYIAD